MALGDVEFLEVAPREPFHAVVVADRWVVVPDRRRDTPSGNVPAGSLAVFDSLANTAEGWKGLGFENDIAATADHAWIISHASASPTRSSRTLFRFRPSTSASALISAPGLTAESVIVAVGDTHLWIFDRTYGSSPYADPQVYEIATGLFTSYAGPGVRIESACWDGGSYIYAFGPSNLYRFHVGTGAYTTMSPASYSSPDITLTTLAAGSIWWGLSGQLKRYNPVTNAVSVAHSYVTGHINGGFAADPDGVLYGVVRNSDTIIIIDPLTLTAESYTITSSRGQRAAIAAIGHNLYIPAGAPLVR